MDEHQHKDQNVERFLDLIQRSRRGKLKLYIGMAAGVGKTYRMLQEAHTLLDNGVDVTLAYIETHGRKETEALLKDLPIIPRRKIFYKGKELEEMDLQAVLNIRPEVVLIDELAHTNVPGSTNEKRWEDVRDVLHAGINVISAVNIQHIESLNAEIEKISGIEVTERIPDMVLKMADEVVNIDLTAKELITRLKEGKIYDPSKVRMALSNFFRPDKILQLRELALKEVAHYVEKKIEGAHAPDENFRAERFLVCIDTREKVARRVIRKAARFASSYNTTWYVVYVQTPDEAMDKISLASQRHLINNFKLATELGGEVVKLEHRSISNAIINFAKEKRVSLIIIGRPRFRWWHFLFKNSILRNLLRKLEDSPIDLLIIS